MSRSRPGTYTSGCRLASVLSRSSTTARRSGQVLTSRARSHERSGSAMFSSPLSALAGTDEDLTVSDLSMITRTTCGSRLPRRFDEAYGSCRFWWARSRRYQRARYQPTSPDSPPASTCVCVPAMLTTTRRDSSRSWLTCSGRWRQSVAPAGDRPSPRNKPPAPRGEDPGADGGGHEHSPNRRHFVRGYPPPRGGGYLNESPFSHTGHLRLGAAARAARRR
jgi:hypothetical protein